jgi:hypothetical protein
VLIAVVVLGLASTSLMLGFSTSIWGSSDYRSVATVDTVLRSAAEEVTTQLQQQSSTQWGNCSAPQVPSVPSGYTAQILSEQYWNGTTFASTCVANAAQLDVISVTTKGTTYQISVVVDDPLTRSLPVSGAATKLVFVGQPGSVSAGSAISPPPVVAVEDAAGNVVTTDLSPVSLTITAGTGTSGATLSTNCTGNEFYGVVTFSNCSITSVGTGYTLTATDGTLTSATSGTFNITAGNPSALTFISQPVTGANIQAAGTGSFTVSVAIQDVYGDTVLADSSDQVTLAISNNPASGVLSCAGGLTATAASGVASFTGCAITVTGAGYTLTAASATSPSLSAPTNANSFNIIAGGPAALRFASQPATGANIQATGTGSFSASVAVLDANGNIVLADNSDQVTLAISANPGSGVLSCTGGLTATVSAGTGSFTGCAISKVGSGYTLTASSSTSPSASAPSNADSFNVVAGSATSLAVSGFPTSTVAGVSHTFTVTALDADGNTATGYAGTVSFTASNDAVAILPANSMLTSGTGTFSATFKTVAGGTKTLTATDTVTGTIAGSESGISVTAGTATQLVFTPATPGPGSAGSPIPNASVSVEDAYGNVVTSASGSVVISIKSGSPQSSFTSGTTTVVLSSGVANFSNLVVITPGSYTFTGTPSGISGVTTAVNSAAFTVTAGTATKLVWDVQPVGGVTEGINFATQPKVYVEDAYGNVATTNASSVTLALNGYTAGNGGATQGTLGCTNLTVTASAGVATFAACQITGTAAAGTYTLTATDGSLTAAPASSNVSITYGTATKLGWGVQPVGGVTEGTSFATQPVVYVEDAYGNDVTNNTSSVTLALNGYTTGNGGTTQGTLGCTNLTVTASAGVATFAACQITGTAAAGTYTLKATDGSLTAAPASSGVSIIAGTATKLGWGVQPVGGVTEGTSFATQPKVYVEDVNGNVATGDTSSVTLALNGYTTGNGGTTQGTLGCTNLTVTASAGVATFAACQITGTAAAGTYTLKATDGSLTAAPASSNVSITAGTATKLVWDVQPVGGVTEGINFATQPKVYVEDAYGNVATTNASSVTLALNGYTAGNGGATQGTLGCTNLTVTASAGVATFAACQITGTAAAGTYTLTATDGSLTAAPASSNVSITYGTATKLGWGVQPVGGVTEGTSFATQPVVYVEDAYGNDVTNNTSSVTLALNGYTTGNGGTTQGTLGCTNLTVTASAGVATFAACQITGTAAAGTYTLKATDGSLTAAPASSGVSIIAGTATKLGWGVQPVGGVTEGTSFATQPKVYVEDVNGNVATGDTSSVTLALNGYTTGNGGTTQGTLGCTNLTVTASAGVATFAACKITGTAAAGTYTLKATDGSLTAAPASSGVSIIAGTATKLAFTPLTPGPGVHGIAIPNVAVSVEDTNGNVVTTASGSVQISIKSGSPQSGFTSGTTLVGLSSGVASFTTLVVTSTGSYTFTAAPISITGVGSSVNSSAFNVT